MREQLPGAIFFPAATAGPDAALQVSPACAHLEGEYATPTRPPAG
jgi:hypothetical protein